MKVTVGVHIKKDEAMAEVRKAARLAMRDTVVDVTADAVAGSPWKTGNNRRSLKGEASGFGGETVDDNKVEGAVYSTSGYGGYLETGTSRMPARPYIKPAADIHLPKFPEKLEEHLP